MERRIILNPEVLSPNYLPEKVLFREKEASQLLSNLENFVNCFIVGNLGVGKSTLAKHVILKFNRSRKGYACYIDCSIYQTTYSVLKEVIPRSDFILYRSNYELIKELLKQVRQKRFAICLDNFENLREKGLISKLMSLGLCVILISDTYDNFNALSESVRANVPSIIRLSNYSVDQAFEILKGRAEKALARWSYSDAIIKKIAEKTKGNIALGINALKLAALNAENRKSRAIEETDIPQLNCNCPQKLKPDEALILQILREWKALPSGRLFAFYQQKARFPKQERTFRSYMRSLCYRGLVKAYGDKRGRFYEIVESEPHDNGKAGM